MMKYFWKRIFLLALLTLAIPVALGGLAGCSKNAYLERNVDYVSNEVLLEQEVVLKDNLAKVKRIYDEALRSGEEAAIEGAKAQYKDYTEKYKIVVDELKSRYGKGNWQDAAAREREKMAAEAKSPAPVIERDAADAPASPLIEVEQAENIIIEEPAAEAAPVGAEAAPAPVEAETVTLETAASGPVSGGSYVVARGDSLSAIAGRFKVSPAALMQANGISDPDKIAAGQTLVIPGVGDVAPASPAASASPEIEMQEVPAGDLSQDSPTSPASAPDQPETYVVKRGDTLKAIAIRLGVNSKTLMEKNNIENPDQIKAGQTLILR
jgi:LysM repeat protein